MRTKFTIAGLGGAFDHFHKGHEEFLKFAAEAADYLIIGISTKELIRDKKNPQLIQPWHERARQVKHFCQDNHIAFEIIKLSDPYGPTIDRDTRIEAIVVTEETVKGADKINEIRRGMSARELQVFIFDMVNDERGLPIHAENIRAGEISRQGIYYAKPLEAGLKLSAGQRQFFSKAQGKIVNSPSTHLENISLVGDFTFDKFLSLGWEYDLAVYDRQTKRGEYQSKLISEIEPDRSAANPAGTITPELLKILESWSQGEFKHVLVEGEEDLATIALVLTLPLNSVIYYGQPDKGMVELVTTEKIKRRFYEALT